MEKLSIARKDVINSVHRLAQAFINFSPKYRLGKGNKAKKHLGRKG